jgi:hypothetical protein
MSDKLPLVGPLKERAKDGVDRLLLAPVFLIGEIVAVLFPGILFTVLLLVKGNHSVLSGLQSTILGYRTKLFVALVFSYLAGTVFSYPAGVLLSYRMKKWGKQLESPEHSKDATQKFYLGVFLLPSFFGTEHTLDYFVLSIISVFAQVSTGAVLLVSSLIPGDHGFRWIEAGVGAFLCVRGYQQIQMAFNIAVALFGISLSETIKKIIPGNLSMLEVGLRLMSPQPTGQTTAQAPGQPPPSQDPPAETSK